VRIDSKRVTAIGWRAFASQASLKSVTLPFGISSIGYEAFSDCINLTSINLPASVRFIADDAFKNCNKVILTVPKGSYAETYAKKHNLRYTHP
jgi:hypothetical protein